MVMIHTYKKLTPKQFENLKDFGMARTEEQEKKSPYVMLPPYILPCDLYYIVHSKPTWSTIIKDRVKLNLKRLFAILK